MKKAAFILGSLEYKAVRRGESITDETLATLDEIATRAGVEASIIFATQEAFDAGKSKSKLGIKKLRGERSRVLSEIGDCKPDLVVCFGPVASAVVFGKGNLVEGELLRRAHYPLGPEQPPVFVTFSMEYASIKTGLVKWLALDVEAAVNGWADPEWGIYKVMLPSDADYETKPGWLWPHDPVGFDLETYPGLSPWDPDARIRMVVLSSKVGYATVVQGRPDSTFPQWVYELAANRGQIKSGSNIKFDFLWWKRFGHMLTSMWDTSTVEHIIDESNPKKDLKSLTFKYVPKLADYSRDQRDMVRARSTKGNKNGDGWKYIADEEMYQYAGGDGEASIGAFVGQWEIVERQHLEQPVKLFMNLYEVLCEMEHNGACIDLDENLRLDALYQGKLAALRDQITPTLGPINLNSIPQLVEALKRTVKGIDLSPKDMTMALGDDEDDESSTKRQVLEREAHKHPVIGLVLEYRKYRVRHSTFIHNVREKHAVKHGKLSFIHPSFNTAVTDTFRLSSSRPNGQNIPRKDKDDADLTVKRQFVSRFEGGSITDADQSQVEIRYAAWLSGDEKMLEAIRSGHDIHLAMASIMLSKPVAPDGLPVDAAESEYVTDYERQTCKARTFLILYGGGAKKLARDLKVSRRKAQKMIDEYFETFSGLKQFIDHVHNEVHLDLQVTTEFGLTRRFKKPDYWDSPEGWAIQRQAFNTRIQSPAACLTYVSMIWLHKEMRERNLRSKIFLQVHDSILVDTYPGEEVVVSELLTYAMDNAAVLAKSGDYTKANINVPLKGEVANGPNWGTTKKENNGSNQTQLQT